MGCNNTGEESAINKLPLTESTRLDCTRGHLLSVGEHFLWLLTVWERKSFRMCLEASFSFIHLLTPPPPSIEHPESCIESRTISAAHRYFCVHCETFFTTCNYSVGVLCQIHTAGSYGLSSYHPVDSYLFYYLIEYLMLLHECVFFFFKLTR